MNALDNDFAKLAQLIKRQEPEYECHRCGQKFTRNGIRALWCRDQGELLFIEACHEHANELEQEGWHEQ